MIQEKLNVPEFEPNPNFRDVTLFTGTFYGEDDASRLRQQLALDMFDQTDKTGVKIIVSDGGSNNDFLYLASTHPSVVLIHEPVGSTMGESRRFALDKAIDDAATDPKHIFMWLEPEKVNLADADAITTLVTPIREGKADVVVPRRIDKSTLPKQQAWLESRANHRATKLMKSEDPESPNKEGDEDLDLWYGPKVFNKAGAEYFSRYKGKLDKWDSIIAPVLQAYKGGLEVASVPVDFTYPTAQSTFETDNKIFKRKRVEQYGSILIALGDTFWQEHELTGAGIAKTSAKPKQ